MERGGLPLISHLLQHTLRSLCADTQWVYSVFWRILPRNFPPPKWDIQAEPFDRSKGNKRNWILVWEDGFCDFVACSGDGMMESQQAKDIVEEEASTSTLQPELFFKMSHDVYNFGEGFMGKIAVDNSHKWIYRDPSEHEIASLSPWQGSLDLHPRTWEAQFKAGIQTIAVVAVGEGLLQLGSTKKVVEDLNFVLTIKRKFHCLRSIPGVFAPHPTSELLLARINSRTANYKGGNTDEDEGGSWQFTGDGTLKITDYLTYRNRAEDIKPLFQHDSQLLGEKLPLLSDGTVPDLLSRSKCRVVPLQAASTDTLKPSNRVSPVSFEEPSLCFNKPQPVVPSMSSLQALLSKLPAVTAAEGPALSYIPDNSPVLMDRSPFGSYINTWTPPSSSRMTQTTPQLSTAAADSISQLLLQSGAVRYASNCTTTGAGNCTLGTQRSMGVPPVSIAAEQWSYIARGAESDGSENAGLEAANHGFLSEFDALETGAASNTVDFSNRMPVTMKYYH